MDKFYQIKSQKRLLLLGKLLNNFFQYTESGTNVPRKYFYFRNEYGSSIMEICLHDTSYRIAGQDNLDGANAPHKTHQQKLTSQIKKEDFKYRLSDFQQNFLPKLKINDFVIIHGDDTTSVFAEKVMSFFSPTEVFYFDSKKEDSKLLFESNNIKFFGLINLAESQVLFIKNAENLSKDSIDKVLNHYIEYKNLLLILHYSKKVDFMKFKLREEKFKYFSF